MDNVKLLRTVGNYSLVEHDTSDGSFYEYIVVKNFNIQTQSWDTGDYFTPGMLHSDNTQLLYYSKALDFLLYKAGIVSHYKGEFENQKIPYNRIVELATKFKDELVDSYSERDFFEEECEMTDEELDFFGLDQLYEKYKVTVKQTFEKTFTIAVPHNENDPLGAAEDKAKELMTDWDLSESDVEVYEPKVETSSHYGTYKKTEILDCDNDID